LSLFHCTFSPTTPYAGNPTATIQYTITNHPDGWFRYGMRIFSNACRRFPVTTFYYQRVPFCRCSQSDGVPLFCRANAGALGQIEDLLCGRHWRRDPLNCLLFDDLFHERQLAMGRHELDVVRGWVEHRVYDLGRIANSPARSAKAEKRLVVGIVCRIRACGR